METELTKKIKRACHTYKPALNTKLRTIRYADEVVCPNGGVVDVVRFEDYIKTDESFCALENPERCNSTDQIWIQSLSRDGCKLGEGNSYPNSSCRGCVWRKTVHILDMLITCYEVKITTSDFKSKHGHNFYGNRNYYIVSADIYEQIKELVPEDIGIIVFYKETGYMKTKKECKHKDIPDDVKVTLLYNALKKWCDGNQTIFRICELRKSNNSQGKE